MKTIAPQFDIYILKRQNLLFLVAAVLLHLFALHGFNPDKPPAKARMQENSIAVQFRDVPDEAEKKLAGISAKPGPLAAPASTSPTAVKKTVVAAPVRQIEVETVPKEAATNEPVVQTPPPPVKADTEVQAADTSSPVSNDSVNTDGPQTYPVYLPPAGKITMRIVRTEPNRHPAYGDSTINWSFDNRNYKLSIDASLDLLLTSVNLYQISSEGSIMPNGLAPSVNTEKRRSRSETATHFDNENKRVSFSSSNKTLEMQEGIQDKASILMQLAGIARAEPGKIQVGREIRIQVAEERDLAMFSFVVVGLEEIDTKIGKIMAWHLVRPPRPGSYNSKLEVWLAPDQYWYPVQIQNTESNGAVTTQTVTNIVSIPGN